MMKWLLTALVALLIASATQAQATEFRVYLVRHAEKAADGTRDPDLTETGQHRADALVLELSGQPIEAVWSSDYKRTRQTARPLAEDRDLELRLYDPGDSAAMAGILMDEAGNALVAGHSNTIPALVAELCECQVDPIEENDYSQFYIIHVDDGEIRLESLNQDDWFKAD